jgi:hypothetical protein
MADLIDAQTVKTTETGARMAMTARSSAMGASVISAVRRRVSSCVSSSIPPV